MFKQIGSEDFAFKEEGIVIFKGIQYFVQGTWNRADFTQFFFGQVVQVTIQGARYPDELERRTGL